MDALKFMQDAVDYFKYCICKSPNIWAQGLMGLLASYRDLQHSQQLSRPIIETEALVKNEEFLRYVAAILNNVGNTMEVHGKRFAPSRMFEALHYYEQETGKDLNNKGLSSLQQIALSYYAADFMKGDAHDALVGSMHTLGEYLLGIDSNIDSNVEALKHIDAMRLAILRWMPPYYYFIDLTLECDDE